MIKEIKLKSQKLHKKQIELVEAQCNLPNKYYLSLQGRNAGKTSVSINIMLYEVLTHPETNLYFISQTHQFSKTIFDKVVKQSLYFIDGYNKSDKIIKFKNGSVISFFSFQNYENLRGNNFADIIILDEACRLPNLAWESVLKQLCYKPKKVLLLTTPRSKKNQVYTFQNTFNPYVVKATTFDNPHISDEDKELTKLQEGTPLYRQETLAEQIDDGGMVFKTNNLVVTDTLKSNIYYTGVDLAVEQDQTVITTINEHYQIVDIERFQKTTYEEIINRIIKHQLKQKSNLMIEKNNFGGSIIESVAKKCVVKPFVTTNDSKQKIISRLQFVLDNGNLKFSPFVSEEMQMNLLFELDSFEYKFNSNGNITFSAPSGITDDMVMSLAICIQAKDNVGQTPIFTPIKNKHKMK